MVDAAVVEQVAVGIVGGDGQGDACGQRVLVEGVGGVVVAGGENEAVGGTAAVPDEIVLIGTVERGGIGGFHLPEIVVGPIPVGGIAAEGAAAGGDVLSLAQMVHVVSVAGTDGAASIVLDGGEHIAGGLIGAQGLEDGAAAPGEGVGHEILLRSGGGADAGSGGHGGGSASGSAAV